MTVYLVRHAVAVGRSDWPGDDDLRPLTKRGGRQARGLVDLLVDADVRRVASSPAVRCLDTVAPLASTRGLDVESAPGLAEGAATKDAVELARTVAAKRGDAVLCTHGDVMLAVMRRLSRDGMRTDGDLHLAKGSAWALSWDGGHFTKGRYLPPPA
jgi:broad specificity phosphatase PhoE